MGDKYVLNPIGLQDLMDIDLPEPQWAVKGLVPVGFTILAGAPKVGKSWFVLEVALAVSQGRRALGQWETTQGRVLYLALEDNAYRIRRRIHTLGCEVTNDLQVVTMGDGFPFLDKGGLAILETDLQTHPTRLLVIDTISRAQSLRKGHQNQYEVDVKKLAPVQALAHKYDVALIAVTHTRKADAVDVMAAVTGSYGIVGTADSVMVLQRPRHCKEGKLWVMGKDVEEMELVMAFNGSQWTYLVPELGKELYGLSSERQEIMLCFRDAGVLTCREIADKLKKGLPGTRKLVGALTQEGYLIEEKGFYRLPITL